VDPRIARTQASLQQALLELARERAFADITVGDIAERAGVNRSSFYQHYADKETLLADALDAIVEEAGMNVQAPVAEDGTPAPAFVGFLEHVAAHADVYRWALGSRGSAVVADRLRARIEDLVRHHIDAAGEAAPFQDIPVEILAAGIAGSGMGALRAWLEREPLAPVGVASGWIWRMLLGPLPLPAAGD